jgi:hypothetical protein
MILLQGVQQFQSVERTAAEAASREKLCCCGKLADKYFEAVGSVVWRGRSAIIGPPIHKENPQFRSVLGLEGPAETELRPPAFS